MKGKILALFPRFCLFVFVASAFSLPIHTGHDVAGTQTLAAGNPEIVLSPLETRRIGLRGWPDSNISSFFLKPSYYLSASNANDGSTEIISTATLNSLSTAHRVTRISALARGKRGAFDHDYAGGGTVYYDHSSGILIQLYHGEFWYGGGSVPSLPAYSSLGLAVSTDMGRSWWKLGEVISASARREHHCQVDIGNGSLGLRPDGFLYSYYSDMSAPCGAVEIGLARARLSDIVEAAKNRSKPLNPGRLFMKYYNGAFNQPGVIDPAKPALGGGLFTPMFSYPEGGWPTMSSVAYDIAIHRYVMAYVAGWDQNRESGIALRLSEDGLHWSSPTVFRLGQSAFYPSLLNVSGEDPNLLGETFYIYYVNPFPGVERQNLMRVMVAVK